MDVPPPSSPPEPIGHRIKFQLDGLGQSPAWLADKAGVPRSTVHRILTGDRNPTPDTLQLLAPVLGVTLDQLVAGTDAVERVKEAQGLVSREHYNAAIRQVIEFERNANNLAARLRETEEALRGERERRQRAEGALGSVERERDDARHAAERNEHDARRYREALERAVADVARLQTQVRELVGAVGEGKRTGHIAAMLAGVAAVASVATYLVSDPGAGGQSSGARTPSTSQKKAAKGGPSTRRRKQGHAG
ncbi:helix-turn-helix domain-containing protein [Sorangium sp. So ce117]|uniref:helix-turn-helix domain-containing protein n=1 Tax=Sorangium sp. So ce117 TaxID=3133277 RepID=UPI003F612E9E